MLFAGQGEGKDPLALHCLHKNNFLCILIKILFLQMHVNFLVFTTPLTTTTTPTTAKTKMSYHISKCSSLSRRKIVLNLTRHNLQSETRNVI